MTHDGNLVPMLRRSRPGLLLAVVSYRANRMRGTRQNGQSIAEVKLNH